MYIVRLLFFLFPVVIYFFFFARESDPLVLQRLLDRVLGGDDRRRLGDVPAEDLGLEEPGEPDGEFVPDEFLGGDLEDLCNTC